MALPWRLVLGLLVAGLPPGLTSAAAGGDGPSPARAWTPDAAVQAAPSAPPAGADPSGVTESLNAAGSLYLGDALQAAVSRVGQALEVCPASVLCQALRVVLRRLHYLQAYASWSRLTSGPPARTPPPLAGLVAAWEAELRLDHHLFGPRHTPVRGRLRGMLAEGWSQLAEEALARGHLRKARLFLGRVQGTPGSPRTAALWQHLRERVRDLYLEGYALEELDPELAAQRWGEVVELGLAGEEAVVRARERLEALRRRTAEGTRAGPAVGPTTVPPGPAGSPPQ